MKGTLVLGSPSDWAQEPQLGVDESSSPRCDLPGGPGRPPRGQKSGRMPASHPTSVLPSRHNWGRMNHPPPVVAHLHARRLAAQGDADRMHPDNPGSAAKASVHMPAPRGRSTRIHSTGCRKTKSDQPGSSADSSADCGEGSGQAAHGRRPAGRRGSHDEHHRSQQRMLEIKIRSTRFLCRSRKRVPARTAPSARPGATVTPARCSPPAAPHRRPWRSAP